MDNQDYSQLMQMIFRFLAFIKAKDGEDIPFSFQGKNTYLGREENYKAKTFLKAQEALQYWLNCIYRSYSCGNILWY